LFDENNGQVGLNASERGFAMVILKLKVKNIRQFTGQSTGYKTVAPGRKFPSAGIQADLDLEKAIHTTAFSVLHQLKRIVPGKLFLTRWAM
jgi:hypothetical protein